MLGLLYVCSIAFDLIAYQCGGDPACIGAQRSSQPLWSPLRWMSFLDAGWLAGHQFRQLAAAALLPLAVVGLLGFLARSTRERYEQTKPSEVVDYEGEGNNPLDTTAVDTEIARDRGLEAPWFWYGEPLARTLGRAHLAAAIAVIAWSLAAAAEALGAEAAGSARGRSWPGSCSPSPWSRWPFPGHCRCGTVVGTCGDWCRWPSLPWRWSPSAAGRSPPAVEVRSVPCRDCGGSRRSSSVDMSCSSRRWPPTRSWWP